MCGSELRFLSKWLFFTRWFLAVFSFVACLQDFQKLYQTFPFFAQSFDPFEEFSLSSVDLRDLWLAIASRALIDGCNGRSSRMVARFRRCFDEVSSRWISQHGQLSDVGYSPKWSDANDTLFLNLETSVWRTDHVTTDLKVMSHA